MKSSYSKPLGLAVAAAFVLSACAGAAAPAPTAAPAATAAPAKPTDVPKPAATAIPLPPTPPPAPAGKTNVNIYLDADTNITDWYSNIMIPAFEKEYPQYKANLIQMKGPGMNVAVDRLVAAKQTNSDPQAEIYEYDVRGRPETTKDGLWLKLDASNVPNAKGVLPAAIVSEFNMPYRGSQVLLAYDSAKIKDADVPRTFPALMEWVKKNPGQFTYGRPDKGGSGGNFVVRAIHEVTGKDPDKFKGGEADPVLVKEFDKAWEMLRSIHEFTYDKGNYPAGNQPALLLLANGSVNMVSAWSDQVLVNIDKGVLPATIKMAQFTDLPMSGGYAQFAVPAGTKNKDGALAWINFTLKQENQVNVIKSLGGFPALKWDQFPQALQTQFNSVVADRVPTWPGGKWDAERNKGWYEKVATNIKQ
ncbi:MAG: extracellular solute-binding protein [Thermoflexales bacterium]